MANGRSQQLIAAWEATASLGRRHGIAKRLKVYFGSENLDILDI
jgi:hypothetical protein